MSTYAPEFEVVEGLVPSSSDLVLSESVQIGEGAVQSDGSVLLHLIRPCVGKGRGRHLYPATMLEANAEKFSGWKMYLNHLSEAARRALGGLPRDVRDVGGIVDTAFWDSSVPPSGRFGQGAVVGRVKPIKLIRELIDIDARLVECSINATATGVKPGRVGDQRVWVVEGITHDPPGSVDWVTEAGAGGQVATLMESVYGADDPVSEWLDSLSYDELVEHLHDSRPDLAEAVARRKPKSNRGDGGDGDAEDATDGGADEAQEESDEFKSLVKKFVDNGMPETAAKKAARKAMSAKEATTRGGYEVPNLSPDEIREVLESSDGQVLIAEAVREEIRALNLGDRVEQLVEGRLDDERDKIREETEARANRRVELRDLCEYAHGRIEGTKLTPKLKARLMSEFAIVEGYPTASLNVVADVDEHGSVVKSAKEKLDETLDAEIREAFEILAEAAPTRVRGQGPRDLRESTDGGKPEVDKDGKLIPPTADDVVGERTAQLLREAGISDPVRAMSITPEAVRDRHPGLYE